VASGKPPTRETAGGKTKAAAKLDATGQPAGDLPGFAAGSIRRAGHIDAVAEAVRKALG
jgi:hypothetical protein